MLHRLAQVIAAAATQREIDQRPCPTCGGDPLRPAFDGRTDCHAPWPKEDQTDEWHHRLLTGDTEGEGQ